MKTEAFLCTVIDPSVEQIEYYANFTFHPVLFVFKKLNTEKCSQLTQAIKQYRKYTYVHGQTCTSFFSSL